MRGCGETEAGNLAWTECDETSGAASTPLVLGWTKRDWDFLQGLGCTYAQGFHIAKPMQASALPGWLEDWQHFF